MSDDWIACERDIPNLKAEVISANGGPVPEYFSVWRVAGSVVFRTSIVLYQPDLMAAEVCARSDPLMVAYDEGMI